MTGQIREHAYANANGVRHVTLVRNAVNPGDPQADVRAIFLTAHRLARIAAIRSSRLPDPMTPSWTEEGDIHKSQPQDGCEWKVTPEVTKHHGAIPGMLVRESEAKAYEELAVPVAKVALWLATREPILNGAGIVLLRPQKDGGVEVHASIGLQVPSKAGIFRAPVDPRPARVLFAIAYARWLREGEVFHTEVQPNGDKEAITVMGTRASFLRSPESATLRAAGDARLRERCLAECEPVIAWLREGGLSDEAEGLIAAISELGL